MSVPEDAKSDLGNRVGRPFSAYGGRCAKAILEHRRALNSIPGWARPSQLRASFTWLDADESGTLSLEELKSKLKVTGDARSEAEIEAFFRKLDTNGDGVVDFAEFEAGEERDGFVLTRLFEVALQRGLVTLPPADEDDAPEPEGLDADGVPFAAKRAAEVIRRLDAPLLEHPDDRLFAAAYADMYSSEDASYGVGPWAGEPDETNKREATLRWVRGALERTAAGDQRYKRPLLYVIANLRLWPDPDNPEEPGFAQLKAFADSKLDAIGEAAERDIYEALNLGETLDGLCGDVESVHPRQCHHAGLHPPICRGNPLFPIFRLLIAAHALDAAYKAKATAAFRRAAGTGEPKAAAVKGFMRMYAKLKTDHAGADWPEAYENVDCNREAWVLKDVPRRSSQARRRRASTSASRSAARTTTSGTSTCRRGRGSVRCSATTCMTRERHGASWRARCSRQVRK